MEKFSRNPVLSNDLYLCDVEAHEFDGRLYLYGSYGNDQSFIHIFSSDDLLNWVDHGVAFSISDVKWIETKALWAPDCAYKDGVYYLYYSIPSGEMGVAKSDKPYGPFEDIGKINVMGIDPSVLVDDDGAAYLYWGQCNNVRAAKLKENMYEIDESTITQPLTVEEHEMHEGSSVRKINGKYYYVYTETHRRGRVKPTCQGYSVSDSPLSGFEYRNIIVDCFDCDPESFNNHGCINSFKGQWYIFYHRATNAVYGWNNPRQLCIEKIDFDQNGDIKEVPTTSSGMNDSILATEVIEGCNACGVSCGAYIGADTDSKHFLAIKNINPHCTATFRYIDFNGEDILKLRYKGQGNCRIDIFVDDNYHDSVEIAEGMFYKELERNIKPINGRRTLLLKFYGLFNNFSLDEISFMKK